MRVRDLLFDHLVGADEWVIHASARHFAFVLRGDFAPLSRSQPVGIFFV